MIEKSFFKFGRLSETYVAFAPKGFKSFSMSMPLWLREKLFLKKLKQKINVLIKSLICGIFKTIKESIDQ